MPCYKESALRRTRPRGVTPVRDYSRSHLSDPALLNNAAANPSSECGAPPELLADLAEIDARKLYLPAAYPSLYAWCVGELGMAEDAACRRIRVARAARLFPGIFEAVAEGRLNLTAVVLLAPHLNPDNADELLAAAEHKSKSEIERLLVARCPRPHVPASVTVLSSPPPTLHGEPVVLGSGDLSAPARIEKSSVTPPRVAPLAPQRYALQ